MNVSLARESPGRGPKATRRSTGRYKVEATADVSSQGRHGAGSQLLCPDVPVRLVLGIGGLNSPGEKAARMLVEHRHEAKECNGLNQSSSKNTQSHPWAMSDGCFLVAPRSLEWAGKTKHRSRSAFLFE